MILCLFLDGVSARLVFALLVFELPDDFAVLVKAIVDFGQPLRLRALMRFEDSQAMLTRRNERVNLLAENVDAIVEFLARFAYEVVRLANGCVG